MPQDHRQLGKKIGMCSRCGKTIYARQASVITQVTPLKLRHEQCSRNETSQSN